MRLQRTLLGCAFGLAACAALAQADGSLRWRSSRIAPLGLQPAIELRLPCGALSLACDSSMALPLYSAPRAPHSLSMQLGQAGDLPLKTGRPQGLSLNLVGRAGIAQDLGVYGRIGTAWARPATQLSGTAPEGSLSYGVGLSWSLSRSASAVVGWDSYDVRGSAGEARDVRSTSLGLQWRY
jgi:OmpA-OmpF porin, OOP family